jgi:hypothetical protein
MSLHTRPGPGFTVRLDRLRPPRRDGGRSRLEALSVVDLDVAVGQCAARGVTTGDLDLERIMPGAWFGQIINVDPIGRRGAIDGGVAKERGMRPRLDQRRHVQTLDLGWFAGWSESLRVASGAMRRPLCCRL